ncbi:hypothetical protein MesoLj113c_17600 [Mesorhizobium sp. 113-3-9]|nr:hypothetical protein MesoLj113c_17600 [Mesorhizobium sp. 113-3-9]
MADLSMRRHASLQHPEALSAARGCAGRGYQAFIAHNADGAERELRRRLRDVETLCRAMCKPEGTG